MAAMDFPDTASVSDPQYMDDPARPGIDTPTDPQERETPVIQCDTFGCDTELPLPEMSTNNRCPDCAEGK